MHVLGLDTCFGAVSVALGQQTADGVRLLAELAEEPETGRPERLVAMIAELLAGAGTTVMELGRVAVTLGPGSFTGVRTGIAAARALRLAAGMGVVGTTSLAVLAHAALRTAGEGGQGRPLLIAVDARRGRLYVQLFGATAQQALSDPAEVSPAEALALAGGRSMLVAGSGAPAIAAASHGRHDIEVLAARLVPRAADLIEITAGLAPLEAILPIYVRPPDAKPQASMSLARSP